MWDRFISVFATHNVACRLFRKSFMMDYPAVMVDQQYLVLLPASSKRRVAAVARASVEEATANRFISVRVAEARYFLPLTAKRSYPVYDYTFQPLMLSELITQLFT